MSVAKGVVTKISVFDSSYGPMHNVTVDGETYGFGKVRPSFSEGAKVAFEWTAKGKYKNADPKTVEVLEKVSSTPAAAPAKGSYNSSRFDPETEKKRQDIISRQAAANTAVATFNALAALDLLPIGKSGKASDKYDAALAVLDELADHWYNRSMGISSSDSTVKDVQEAPKDEVWED